jgi:hypothetical protein
MAMAERWQPTAAAAGKELHMNRKREDGSQATAVEERAPSALTDAMDALVHGYSEEMALYATVRTLTLRQRDTLHDGWDLDRFGDLLDEKEDLLQMIGQIESLMKHAKSLVLLRKPPECPSRRKLERMLDQLTAVIEEIRAIEGGNAEMIEDVLANYETSRSGAAT